MFLLNASINLESHLFYRFTIQNVPIKSYVPKIHPPPNSLFTIQNVPIKFLFFNASINLFLIYNTKCSY